MYIYANENATEKSPKSAGMRKGHRYAAINDKK